MPVIRPPIMGDSNLDSWMNQITNQVNTQISASVTPTTSTQAGDGSDGADGADGADAPHYSEVTLYSDPAVASPPSAPTATITWFTGVISSITAGWSQTPPTIDVTSTDIVYYSKLIFKDSIAPFATTTTTGNTPVALFDFTSLPVVDATSVTAAGALMDSELTDIASVKALNQGVATTDSPTFVAVTVSSGVVDFGDWTITESGGSLYFATLGTNKMKLDASGNLEIVGNITELATIT